MKIYDLLLLKVLLKDFILLLCDIDQAYNVSDVAEVLKLIDEIIEEDKEEE